MSVYGTFMDINAALATIDEEGELEDSWEVSLFHTNVMLCFNLVSANFHCHLSATCRNVHLLLEIYGFFPISYGKVQKSEALYCRFTRLSLPMFKLLNCISRFLYTRQNFHIVRPLVF